ncbi:hypothetical protein M405DRAFT_631016 [Rhizopogon salebrosus TDB-379]|nr:hypothetical protein M405DRAFT_631016 [Rhizopogon salebrosus TDB-379]
MRGLSARWTAHGAQSNIHSPPDSLRPLSINSSRCGARILNGYIRQPSMPMESFKLIQRKTPLLRVHMGYTHAAELSGDVKF